jgi:hypothetical protein
MDKHIINKQFFLDRINIDVKTWCWNWIKYKDKDWYWRLTYNYKIYWAHRFSYTYFKWSILNLHVLHKCDNPSCINPEHLFIWTAQDNTNDMMQKWRICNRKSLMKKINQYEIDWIFIKTWNCINDIQRELKIYRPNICKVCKWKRKTTGWYIWKYV